MPQRAVQLTLLGQIYASMLLLRAIFTIGRKEANMQDIKITFRVRVSDDESRVIITEPTMTDTISFSVFTGIIRKLADFQEEWNEEHKPENREQ